MGAPGQGFRQADNVRHDIRRFAGEHRAGAAKARENLIEDQKKIVFVRERAQTR